jgi:hypothetical protein
LSALRLVTAAISLGLVALAFYDDRFVGGGPGFGVSQALLLAVGVAIGALCAAPRVWNARALTLLVSVALTLGAAELVLRVALGARYYTSIQLDPQLLYRPSPGSRREYTRAAINGGVRVRYAMNSQGFRGDELSASGESLRVVVYGDSFIMAEFSRTEDTFAERLEAYLEQALGERVEVVNAGVAGYGPDQELRRMEAELGSLRPELVIAAIYAGNDFGDILRNKLYRLGDDGGLLENRFSFDPAIERRVAVSRSELILKKVLRDTLGRISGAAGAGVPTGREARIERVERSLEQLVREHHEYVVKGDDVVHELLSDPYNADVSLTPESDSARYRIALMEQIIVRMRAATDALRLPLLLVLIPSPIDVSDDHESGLVDAQAHPAYRSTALTDTLEQICLRHQIPALNLFGPFAAHGASRLYLKGVDDHWNEAGQDLAARLASEVVIAQGLIRARMEARP